MLPSIGFMLLTTFFINLLALTSPLYMILLYDRVLTSLRVETLVILTGMAATAFATYGALETVRNWSGSRLAAWFSRAAGPMTVRDALRGVLVDDPSAYGRTKSLRKLRDFISGPLTTLLDLPFAPLFFIAAFVLHPLIGWLTAVSAALLFAISLVADRLTRDGARRFVEASDVGEIALAQALRNSQAIAAMAMQSAIVERWSRAMDHAHEAQVRASDINGVFIGVSRAYRLLAQSLVLGLGAWLVIDGALAPGLMIAGSIIMGRALAPIDQMLGSWRSLQEARIAYAELAAIAPPRDDLARPAERPSGFLEVERLSYAPAPGARNILSDVRCSVHPGEVMAVIGPSGAGKSTLARLIVGARTPSDGQIRLAGLPFEAWDPETLGRHVGYLPQEVELFDGTLAENIARLVDEPDPVKVRDAAVRAGVHDMIEAMPHGYETRIGSGGHLLSGGQRQRIGLARALYGSPSLVVLDEPNSNLDQAGEQSLMSALRSQKGTDAATVVICHSPTLLTVADTILLIADGEARGFGPADEMMRLLGMTTGPRAVNEAKG